MDSVLSGFANVELPYYSSAPSFTSSVLSTISAMPRSMSDEPGKTPKRKGARSVSTLTPSQLARKRQNDREAQRAIRARTKEHIERLEAEVEELKSQHNADKRVQGLFRRLQILENENKRLRGEMGGSGGASQHAVGVPQAVSNLGGSYAGASVYEDSVGSGIPSPRTSPFSTAEYSPMPDATSYAGTYIPIPAHHHGHSHHHHHGATSHPQAHHAPQVAGGPPSSGSSPCSTSAVTDPDYITGGAATPAGQGYIPTSIPTSMQQHAPGLITSAPNGLGGDGSMHSTPPAGSMFSSPQTQPPPQQRQQQQDQAQWSNMYNTYYPRQVQSPVH